jgi:hypothetical protein
MNRPLFAMNSIAARRTSTAGRPATKRRTSHSLLVALLLATPMLVSAQHPGGRPAAPAFSPPREAAQFDFLIGHWEVTVTPKASGLAQRIHGAPRLLGSWKAWRAFDGYGIEDELRIVDGSGNPNSLTHSLRVFSTGDRRWSSTTLDVYRGRYSAATAEFQNGQMISTGRGTDAEGKPYIARSRFHDITPTGFKMHQDRSSDDGKTWNEAMLKIEAKRVAATAPR